MRLTSIKYFINIHKYMTKFKWSAEPIYRGISFIDRYCERVIIPNSNDYLLTSMACLKIAGYVLFTFFCVCVKYLINILYRKFSEIIIVDTEECTSMIESPDVKSDLLEKEFAVCTILQYNLSGPVIYNFLTYYHHIAKCSIIEVTLSYHLALSSLFDCNYAKYMPSLLAISSIIVTIYIITGKIIWVNY